MFVLELGMKGQFPDKFIEAQKLRDNGQIEEAVALYWQVRDEAKDQDKHFAAESLHMIGMAYYQAKRYPEAKDALVEAKVEFGQTGNEEFVGFVLRDLGVNSRKWGRLEEATQFLRESVETLQKVGNKGHEGISRVKLGRVFADKGNFERAFRIIEEGITLLGKSDEKFFYSSAYLDKAKILIQKGDKEQAMEAVRKSLEILDSFSGEGEFLERRKDIGLLLGENAE